MAIKLNVGRQCVISAKVDIPFADIAVAGKYPAIELPPGAVIVSGYFYDATTGVTGVAISVDDEAGTELVADFAGTFANGRVDVAPTGDVLSVPSTVQVTTTGNASAGSAYLYLEYVVDGRAEFSQG